MRPLARRSVALLAVASAALGSHLALANSKINGIPNECELTTYRVAIGADGKGAKPEKIFSRTKVGEPELVRAFQMAHDGKRIAFHTFAGVALGEANAEPKDHKAIVIY